MTRPPRAVRRGEAFTTKARGLVPPGGDSVRASFEVFEELVLRGVEFAFSRQFDDLPVSLPEVESIRHVMTHAVPIFPALVVYGLLLTGGSMELIDLDVDEDYWGLLADDPDD